MDSISEKVADWVCSTSYKDIPSDVITAARRCILDFFGVTLAGSVEPVADIILRYIKQVGGNVQATLIGSGIKSSCTEIAFGNGVIGHCLDYDDFMIPVSGGGGPHFTAAILPAALAVAEMEHRSGKDLIQAYVLGCEVCYRVGLAVDPMHYNAGWHTTGTEGIFGAVIAACKLLGLNRKEITNALGTAGSGSAGLRENFGTMTKPFHAGQASAKGVKVGLLAGLGFTASKTIFEGKKGFCNVLSSNALTEKITENIGSPFCIPNFVIKLYPCCGGSHNAVFAALEMCKEHTIKTDEISGIDIRCEPLAYKVLTYEDPQDAFEGKFSMHFPIALALAEGGVSLDKFTDEKVRDPVIRNLMAKVKVSPEEDFIREDPGASITTIEITFRNGRRISGRCDYRPGGPLNPVSDEALLEKFTACAGRVLSPERIERSIESLTNLEDVDDISNLMDIFSGQIL